MAIICITRELAAKGEETARELAKLGGYRYIERDYLESRLAEHNVGEEDLKRYDERRPGLWASMSEDRDRYLHFLKEILYEEAAKGNRIILGRGAGAVLGGIPGVLSVRLTAPRAVRLDRIRMAFACDDREAEHQLKQSDHDREGFHRYFFGVDWRDPALYDLTINTGKADPEAAARLIRRWIELTVSAEEEEQGRKRLEELRLRTAVIGAIVFRKNLQIQALDVEVKGGKISLLGFAVSRLAANTAVEAAKSVPGVEEVADELQIIPPFVGS